MPLALVLPLPAEVAARVALPASVPGALPASDLHVTVAALTSAPPDLLGSLAALAAHAAPIAATLSGTGRFASPAAEGDAFYLSVDAPALVELRARIESEHWRFIDRTHGLSPHVTLAYLAPDAAAPLDRFGPEPLRFEALTLWDGDTRTAFLFGSAMDNTTTLDAVALPDTPPAELRLFRDGWNDTTKGRFLLDADGAAEVLRRFAAHGVELAMDFDHGTFTEGGRRRDVPGYIGGLDYRPGDGLYATALRWTEVGLRAIAPGRAPDGTPHAAHVPLRPRPASGRRLCAEAVRPREEVAPRGRVAAFEREPHPRRRVHLHRPRDAVDGEKRRRVPRRVGLGVGVPTRVELGHRLHTTAGEQMVHHPTRPVDAYTVAIGHTPHEDARGDAGPAEGEVEALEGASAERSARAVEVPLPEGRLPRVAVDEGVVVGAAAVIHLDVLEAVTLPRDVPGDALKHQGRDTTEGRGKRVRGGVGPGQQRAHL
jgi:2'-5' RNA ligase